MRGILRLVGGWGDKSGHRCTDDEAVSPMKWKCVRLVLEHCKTVLKEVGNHPLQRPQSPRGIRDPKAYFMIGCATVCAESVHVVSWEANKRVYYCCKARRILMHPPILMETASRWHLIYSHGLMGTRTLRKTWYLLSQRVLVSPNNLFKAVGSLDKLYHWIDIISNQ